MFWAFGWLGCGIIAALIASKKGEGCLGLIVGMLFGPLGIIIAIFSKGDRIPCPFCAELIRNVAKVCPHCQRIVKQ